MKSEQALNIVAMALTASPEALKGILRERVTLVETRSALIEAMEKARASCGCATLKPEPPTPCEPCAILHAAIVRYKRPTAESEKAARIDCGKCGSGTEHPAHCRHCKVNFCGRCTDEWQCPRCGARVSEGAVR